MPKTESSHRTLPMTDEIYNLLIDKKREQQANSELLKDFYIKSDFVCTLANGKVISPNYLSKNFHKVICKSELPKIRFHDLRHSTASNLLARGFSAVQVLECLGHSNATTTLNIYAHSFQEAQARAMDSVAGCILNRSEM